MRILSMTAAFFLLTVQLFAQKEIVKLKAEPFRDERIGSLLEGKADIETNGLAARQTGPTIGGFHNPRTAAGADDESP